MTVSVETVTPGDQVSSAGSRACRAGLIAGLVGIADFRKRHSVLPPKLLALTRNQTRKQNIQFGLVPMSTILIHQKSFQIFTYETFQYTRLHVLFGHVNIAIFFC